VASTKSVMRRGVGVRLWGVGDVQHGHRVCNKLPLVTSIPHLILRLILTYITLSGYDYTQCKITSTISTSSDSTLLRYTPKYAYASHSQPPLTMKTSSAYSIMVYIASPRRSLGLPDRSLRTISASSRSKPLVHNPRSS